MASDWRPWHGDLYPRIVVYLSSKCRCPRCSTSTAIEIDGPPVLVRQTADDSLIATNSARCTLCGWAGLLDALEAV